MLSSITPLGERGRHQRWGVTVSAFGFGSCVGGALLGALCGSVGALFLALLARLSGTRVLTLSAIGIAAGAAIALSLDALTGRVTVPATTRQVDDQWLYRYRGWVYGGGFGLQLGAGLLTVVPAAIGYFVWILAALTGSPALQ